MVPSHPQRVYVTCAPPFLSRSKTIVEPPGDHLELVGTEGVIAGREETIVRFPSVTRCCAIPIVERWSGCSGITATARLHHPLYRSGDDRVRLPIFDSRCRQSSFLRSGLGLHITGNKPTIHKVTFPNSRAACGQIVVVVGQHNILSLKPSIGGGTI